MPKTLVLFHSGSRSIARLAEALAEGASSVRFAEVEVRRISGTRRGAAGQEAETPSTSQNAHPGGYRELESLDSLAEYDALLVLASALGGASSAELVRLLDEAAAKWSGGELEDKIGSVFTLRESSRDGQPSVPWRILTPMASLGMILVPQGPVAAEPGQPAGESSAGPGEPGETEIAAARQHGARVARVTAMVTHVKNHHHHH